MKTRIFPIFLLIVSILAMPVAHAQAMSVEIGSGQSGKAYTQSSSVSVTSEERLPSGKDTFSNLEGSAQKSSRIIEMLSRKTEQINSLKGRLATANPQEREDIALEINKIKMELLAEARSEAKTDGDIKIVEREKVDAGLELCKELTDQNQSCENEADSRKQKLENFSEDQIESLNSIAKLSLQSNLRTNAFANQEMNRKFMVHSNTDTSGNVWFDIKVRDIPESAINQIQSRLEKLDLDSLKLKVEISKNAFFRVKFKADACSDNSTECEQVRQEMLKEANNFLLITIDNLVSRLEKMKLVIQAETTLSENESLMFVQIINQIEVEIKNLNVTAEASTSAKIKARISEANKKLKEFQPEIEKVSGFIQSSRMGSILIRSSHLSDKLNRVLEKMVLDNIDASSTMVLVSDFNAQLETLKTDFQEVNAKLVASASATGEEKTKLVQEAQELIKEFKIKVNQLHEKLREIVMVLKQKSSLKYLNETKVELAMSSNTELSVK